MEDNPYTRMAGSMRRAAQGEQFIQTRVALVVSTSPLIIDVAGLRHQGDALRINCQMKPEHRELCRLEKPEGSLTVSAMDSGGDSLRTMDVLDGTVEYDRYLREYFLEPGDEVLVWTADDQRYYILCKVVKV